MRDKRLGTGGRACVLGGVDGGYPSKFNFHKKGSVRHRHFSGLATLVKVSCEIRQ